MFLCPGEVLWGFAGRFSAVIYEFSGFDVKIFRKNVTTTHAFRTDYMHMHCYRQNIHRHPAKTILLNFKETIMNLRAHWITLAGTALVLSACSTSPQEDTTTDIATSGEAHTSQISTTSTVSTDSSVSSPVILPGSMEDFTLNVRDRVYFDFDRYDLSAKATETLDTQVRWLKRFGNVRIVIGGHADNRGTREYNLALSERRAQSVHGYMVGLGIDPDRITVIAYGKERPAMIGNNEEAWQENRRAVTKIDIN